MNDITRPVPKAKNDGPVPGPSPNPQPPVQTAAMPVPQPTAGTEPKQIEVKDKPKKRIWLRVLIGAIIFMVVAVIVAAVAGYMWYQSAITPVSATMENKNFRVADGASVEQIADSLQHEGLVKSSLATQIYMRLNDKSHIKAGNYVLSPNQSVAEITDWLNQGHTDTLKVTILPGRTLKNLKSDLAQYGFKESDIDAALGKQWDHPVLADKPKEASLEGYIYPETYFMETAATPEEVILRSLDEFERQIENGEYRQKLSEKGFNLHQGVTLASIVGREVSIAEDQRKVSQVFQTRLHEGMNLGSDVTYIYAAELLGVEASPALESPYNTRKYNGLPPGPIANFNLSVLETVVNPANTTYLFFVAGDDGVTHYSYTFAEHEANIAKYCQRACAAN